MLHVCGSKFRLDYFLQKKKKKKSLGLTIKQIKLKHNVAFMNKLMNMSCGRARGAGGPWPLKIQPIPTH